MRTARPINLIRTTLAYGGYFVGHKLRWRLSDLVGGEGCRRVLR
jgi:hypothetical protein